MRGISVEDADDAERKGGQRRKEMRWQRGGQTWKRTRALVPRSHVPAGSSLIDTADATSLMIIYRGNVAQQLSAISRFSVFEVS